MALVVPWFAPRVLALVTRTVFWALALPWFAPAQAKGHLWESPLLHGSFNGPGRVPKKCSQKGIKNSLVATFGPKAGPSWGLIWT